MPLSGMSKANKTLLYRIQEEVRIYHVTCKMQKINRGLIKCKHLSAAVQRYCMV